MFDNIMLGKSMYIMELDLCMFRVGKVNKLSSFEIQMTFPYTK